MNINDPDIDLNLALGSRNYRVSTSVNSSLGAGANANSMVDMTFAASDPLSELVWSPNNGLSLKCANSSMLDKKPFFNWNMAEAKKDISTSPSTRSKGSRGTKLSNKKKICASPKMFRSSGGSSSLKLDSHLRNRDGTELFPYH